MLWNNRTFYELATRLMINNILTKNDMTNYVNIIFTFHFSFVESQKRNSLQQRQT